MLASCLVLASALIVFALGALHLLYTFRGSKLQPRDPALQARMAEVHPGITRETTMWRAWVGFNASHSLGAMLFGAVYGYLAIAQGPLLFGSPFLLAVGLVLLTSYLALGKLYWFSIPFRGILAALVLFMAGVAVALR